MTDENSIPPPTTNPALPTTTFDMRRAAGLPLLLQCIVWLTLGAAFLLILPEVTTSVAAGGLAALVPAGLSALFLRRARSDGSRPVQFLKLVYLSEGVKIFATILLLAICLASTLFQPPWLMAGFLTLLVTGWIGLALVFLGGTRHGD